MGFEVQMPTKRKTMKNPNLFCVGLKIKKNEATESEKAVVKWAEENMAKGISGQSLLMQALTFAYNNED